MDAKNIAKITLKSMIIKTSREWTTAHAHPLRVCCIFFKEVVVVGGGGGLTFKILKAFSFYYCVHSANINKKLYFFGGGASFVLQIHFRFTVHR